LSESETEKKEEKPKAEAVPCPVLPSSVEKILATLDQLDKGEIDEFDAVQQVTGVMKEHRKTKLEALKKLDAIKPDIESEEETAERVAQEEESETATE
jgi:predicted nucleotide-binding protein (sugar kinase/HSP70/actin superfamily)